MNTLKGYIISESGLNILNQFEEGFNNYLLNINRETKEETQKLDEFEPYTKVLIRAYKYNNKLKLLEAFQNSNYPIDQKDFNNSYIEYLKGVYSYLIQNNNEPSLANKIKETIDYWCENSKENEQNKEECIKLLDNKTFSLTALTSTFETFSKIADYELKAVIFIDNIYNENITQCDGTSFWFNKKDEISVTTVYKTILKGENSIIFDEQISNTINEQFSELYKNWTKGKRFESKELEEIIKKQFNNEINENSKISLKPLMYFETINEIELTRSIISDLTEMQQTSIISMSIPAKTIQDTIYNNKVKPEMIMMYFKQRENELILIQKTIEEQTISVFYKITKGNNNFSNIIKLNNKLLVELSNLNYENKEEDNLKINKALKDLIDNKETQETTIKEEEDNTEILRLIKEYFPY